MSCSNSLPYPALTPLSPLGKGKKIKAARGMGLTCPADTGVGVGGHRGKMLLIPGMWNPGGRCPPVLGSAGDEDPLGKMPPVPGRAGDEDSW